MLFLLCPVYRAVVTIRISIQAYRPFTSMILTRSFHSSILPNFRPLPSPSEQPLLLLCSLLITFAVTAYSTPVRVSFFFSRSADGDLSSTHVCSASSPSYHNRLDCSRCCSAENRPSSILEKEKEACGSDGALRSETCGVEREGSLRLIC